MPELVGFGALALALFNSTIQAGWLLGGGVGFGLGDSGLFSAASSQLEDFVGLHLRGSMVLEGLTGGLVFSSASRPESSAV